MPNLHDTILGTLQAVANNVYLVARITEDIGYPDPDRALVFLPDIHLISDARKAAGNFKFTTNNVPMLVDLLRALKALRGNLEGSSQDVSVIHLGDILDLWREAAGDDPDENTAANIANDYSDLMAALNDADLDATIFLGNHDFCLYELPAYQNAVRSRIFGDPVYPALLVVHGDVFDWMERLPIPIKDAAVFYFSPIVPPTVYELGQIYSVGVVPTNPNPDNPNFILCPEPATVPSLSAQIAPLPADYNLSDPANPSVNMLFAEALAQLQERNANHGTALRTVVIGHTHHARILTQIVNGVRYTMIDCGAWIENCVANTPGSPTMKSSQVGVVCGNEARIYQLT